LGRGDGQTERQGVWYGGLAVAAN